MALNGTMSKSSLWLVMLIACAAILTMAAGGADDASDADADRQDRTGQAPTLDRALAAYEDGRLDEAVDIVVAAALRPDAMERLSGFELSEEQFAALPKHRWKTVNAELVERVEAMFAVARAVDARREALLEADRPRAASAMIEVIDAIGRANDSDDIVVIGRKLGEGLRRVAERMASEADE